tara:strand:- start:2846 stop:3037 length:192 start_codon:yes stop_codon:yes gene_type:complete
MKITKHLPKGKGEIGLVQARVPIELKDQVGKILETEGVSWNDLIIACLKSYVEEIETLKKRCK